MGLTQYNDEIPNMFSQFSCPKCRTQCSSYEAAQAHCQQPYNTTECRTCYGTGRRDGMRCPDCNGTGKTFF